MSTVTLITKIHNNYQRKLVKRNLKSTIKGLKVELKICEVTSRGWIQIDVSGEDEKVALRHLAREIGLCPTNLENVERFSTTRGYLTALNKSDREVYVDIGVFSPQVVDAAISLSHMQAQLVDGRKVALRKLIELFGFCENLPLTIKILGVDRKKPHVEAMLSEKQISQYRNWTRSLLDRLVVLKGSFYDVKLALKIAECNRDVVGIETLGLLEYAVVCKLGTDAAGLIPKIGRRLRNASFSVFSPRKILEFLGEDSMS
ncbi:MAG: DUF2110 family protein [Candidatus Bathyarchaeota archaeon]|nr:DUF2110 family protein [Candidatus Bathyarchaeota archaeon]MDH5787997.1 DUF2110 family protein [Candidatus Bathyarchaeota archaeon]